MLLSMLGRIALPYCCEHNITANYDNVMNKLATVFKNRRKICKRLLYLRRLTLHIFYHERLSRPVRDIINDPRGDEQCFLIFLRVYIPFHCCSAFFRGMPEQFPH